MDRGEAIEFLWAQVQGVKGEVETTNNPMTGFLEEGRNALRSLGVNESEIEALCHD